MRYGIMEILSTRGRSDDVGAGYWASVAMAPQNSMVAAATSIMVLGGFLNGVDPRFRDLSPFMKHVIGQTFHPNPVPIPHLKFPLLSIQTKQQLVSQELICLAALFSAAEWLIVSTKKAISCDASILACAEIQVGECLPPGRQGNRV